MAAIKAYADLSQSKTLSKILPLESADMYYREWKRMTKDIRIAHFGSAGEKDLPCWSLVALLSVLPNPSLHQTKDGKWYCTAEPNRIHFSGQYKTPVDACVAMIKKLHELKIL